MAHLTHPILLNRTFNVPKQWKVYLEYKPQDTKQWALLVEIRLKEFPLKLELLFSVQCYVFNLRYGNVSTRFDKQESIFFLLPTGNLSKQKIVGLFNGAFK